MTMGQWFLLIGTLTLCVFLILIILIQRGRGEGLSGAFGGGGGSSAFGAKTGDVFTLITIVASAMFLLANVFGNYVFLPSQAARAPVFQSTPSSSPTPTPAPAPGTGTAAPETGEKPVSATPPASPTGGAPGAGDTETGGSDVKTPETESGETP